MKFAFVSLATLALATNASAQSSAPRGAAEFGGTGVSLSYEGWERFPARTNDPNLIAIGRDQPQRVCTLRCVRTTFANELDQTSLNDRLATTADALVAAQSAMGTVTSQEIVTIDGVAVLDVQTDADGLHQPAAGALVFFWCRAANW